MPPEATSFTQVKQILYIYSAEETTKLIYETQHNAVIGHNRNNTRVDTTLNLRQNISVLEVL